MKTLPNGLTVFNGTPHTIRFWKEEWEGPIEIETDEIISAKPIEVPVEEFIAGNRWDCEIEFSDKKEPQATLVTTEFEPTEEGRKVILEATRAGADIVVGSIIAARAYPGYVMAMTPAPGYERVPPSEKRMSPNKFTVFPQKVELSLEEATRLYGLAWSGVQGKEDASFIERVLVNTD